MNDNVMHINMYNQKIKRVKNEIENNLAYSVIFHASYFSLESQQLKVGLKFIF